MKMNLDKRDKIALGCGITALLLVCFMLLYIPIGPKKRYEDSVKTVTQNQKNLESVRNNLIYEGARLASQVQFVSLLDKRGSRFDLFRFVSRTLSETELVSRATLANVPPSRNNPATRPMVTLDLNGVAMKELIAFLHKVYASNNLVVVNTIRLTPAQNDLGLNCNLRFLTVKI
jgi:hypothetical protein